MDNIEIAIFLALEKRAARLYDLARKCVDADELLVAISYQHQARTLWAAAQKMKE